MLLDISDIIELVLVLFELSFFFLLAFQLLTFPGHVLPARDSIEGSLLFQNVSVRRSLFGPLVLPNLTGILVTFAWDRLVLNLRQLLGVEASALFGLAQLVGGGGSSTHIAPSNLALAYHDLLPIESFSIDLRSLFAELRSPIMEEQLAFRLLGRGQYRLSVHSSHFLGLFLGCLVDPLHFKVHQLVHFILFIGLLVRLVVIVY